MNQSYSDNLATNDLTFPPDQCTRVFWEYSDPNAPKATMHTYARSPIGVL